MKAALSQHTPVFPIDCCTPCASGPESPCDPALRCRITEITSNEPIQGTDDGDTAPHLVIVDALTARLRAERASTGTGRIHTITVACTDGSGNTATGVTAVQVPLELPCGRDVPCW